jgi:hypothetical protein
VSETRKDDLNSPLDRRLLKALDEWPAPDRSDLEWDEAAAAIEERCAAAAAGSTPSHTNDEKFLEAPLPQSAEEGHNRPLVGTGPALPGSKPSTAEVKMGVSTSDRERARSSLKDLARLAAEMNAAGPSSARVSQPTPMPPSGVQRAADSSGDSGIVDMNAIAQSDPNAVSRAQATPLASTGLFDDEPASSGRPSGVQSVPPPSITNAAAPALTPGAPAVAEAVPASLPQPSVAPASAAFAPSAAPPKKKGGGLLIGLSFGGVASALAIAAGVFFFIKSNQGHRLATNAPVTTAAGPVAVATPTATAAEPAADTTATATAPDPTPAPTAAANAKHAGGAKVAGGAAAPKPVATVDPKLVVKDTPPPPQGGPSGSLGDAMKAAAGPSDSPQGKQESHDGPQFAPGSVPQKPSQGAVTGALGAVLPGARACLGPDDPVSRATIVFTSQGTVQSVSVHGGATGKPSEGCIKAALTKAKVPPFAEATYTANVTVRPN